MQKISIFYANIGFGKKPKKLKIEYNVIYFTTFLTTKKLHLMYK